MDALEAPADLGHSIDKCGIVEEKIGGDAFAVDTGIASEPFVPNTPAHTARSADGADADCTPKVETHSRRSAESSDFLRTPPSLGNKSLQVCTPEPPSVAPTLR